MNNVDIRAIPHNEHRYPTVGDWFTRRGTLNIRVSKMSDPRYEILVAFHEWVEVELCKLRGVTEAEVDAFDIAFEKKRKKGNDDEPGDDPKAPYRREHFFATNMERMLAAEMGVDWAKYDAEINALPLTDLKTKTVCVVCSPLFISFAERLARDFGKVYLHVPTSGTFITMNQGKVGSGIPGVEKIDSIYGPHFKTIDLWVFPDIGHSELQVQLEDEYNVRVWGARHGEELEQQREYCKELMQEKGLPVAPWKVVTGMTALRAHLASKKDQHVKINRWRGLTETFFAPDVDSVSSKLDDLQSELGAFKEECPFIVEDDLPDKVEVGTDVYCIDGQYPSSTLIGIEVKDLGYCAEFVAWNSIPEPLRRWNEKMAPYFAERGYRGFLSCEIRIGEDHVPYQIDACCRAGSPPSELYQEFYLNLSEIIWEGAYGNLVDPEPAAKFGAQIVLKSTWANGHLQTIDFPKKFARNIKLFDYVVDKEGRRFVLPLEKDVTEIGAVVGWGDTMEAALEMVKEAGESITGYGIKFAIGPVETAVEEMQKLNEIGVSPFTLEKAGSSE